MVEILVLEHLIDLQFVLIKLIEYLFAFEFLSVGIDCVFCLQGVTVVVF